MSKKYVIEIKPEYEDTTKGVMVLGARESNLYVDTLSIEDLEELNSDYINEHFGELQDEAYKQGYADAERIWRAPSSDNEFYQKGLEDAWKAARRIVVDTDHGGLALGTLCEIFGTRGYSYIMQENTAQQAIDKLKAYKDKQKEDDSIKVGDEVTHKSDSAVWTAVCIRIDGDGRHMNLMGHTGAVGYYPVDDFKKTGRHFNIGEILEAMRK